MREWLKVDRYSKAEADAMPVVNFAEMFGVIPVIVSGYIREDMEMPGDIIYGPPPGWFDQSPESERKQADLLAVIEQAMAERKHMEEEKIEARLKELKEELTAEREAHRKTGVELQSLREKTFKAAYTNEPEDMPQALYEWALWWKDGTRGYGQYDVVCGNLYKWIMKKYPEIGPK